MAPPRPPALIQAPDYRLPKLSADVIYLWPEQRQVDVVPYPYGPWGPSPYGPYWGYGRWGWW